MVRSKACAIFADYDLAKETQMLCVSLGKLLSFANETGAGCSRPASMSIPEEATATRNDQSSGPTAVQRL